MNIEFGGRFITGLICNVVYLGGPKSGVGVGGGGGGGGGAHRPLDIDQVQEWLRIGIKFAYINVYMCSMGRGM